MDETRVRQLIVDTLTLLAETASDREKGYWYDAGYDIESKSLTELADTVNETVAALGGVPHVQRCPGCLRESK